MDQKLKVEGLLHIDREPAPYPRKEALAEVEEKRSLADGGADSAHPRPLLPPLPGWLFVLVRLRGTKTYYKSCGVQCFALSWKVEGVESRYKMVRTADALRLQYTSSV